MSCSKAAAFHTRGVPLIPAGEPSARRGSALRWVSAAVVALATIAVVGLYLTQPPWGSASASRIAIDATVEPTPSQTSQEPTSPPPTTPPPLPATPAPTTPLAEPSPTFPPDKVDKQWPKNPPWDACPAPVWPGQLADGSPGNGRRVLILGDSLTRDSRKPMTSYLEDSGWTPTFRCWGSKRLDWGLDQITRAKKLKQLPEYVIVALGTNDISWVSPSVTERRVKKVLDRLGPNRQVLWVDIDTKFSSFSIRRAAWFNKMIRDVARDRPNVKVVPWKRIAREANAYRYDGIHYGKSGYKLRARELTDALNARARKVDQARRLYVSPTPTSGNLEPSASGTPE